MALASKNLGRGELGGERHAQGSTFEQGVGGIEVSKPKIAQVIGNQDVLWLHITVNDSLLVQEIHGLQQHLKEMLGCHLVHRGCFPYHLLQITLAVKLHSQDRLVVVGPEVQHIDDVRMPESAEDIELTAADAQHLLVQALHHLQCHFFVILLLLRLENLSSRSEAQQFLDVVVAHRGSWKGEAPLGH
eukprot:CAMPEP_0181444726 /NCGR_PEP_ID=MMETSP1110-20121109/25221_1 /TAXON_ID=174948 /ORGANISM="Symbiodinium sp., Strain CCMP421" /LENGTH=187 /DNA_ID=CAMNT_0023568749 /DNA_START=526 /DNA_END=1089 /DNA_ORIENTATION=-